MIDIELTDFSAIPEPEPEQEAQQNMSLDEILDAKQNAIKQVLNKWLTHFESNAGGDLLDEFNADFKKLIDENTETGKLMHIRRGKSISTTSVNKITAVIEAIGLPPFYKSYTYSDCTPLFGMFLADIHAQNSLSTGPTREVRLDANLVEKLNDLADYAGLKNNPFSIYVDHNLRPNKL